MSENKYTNTLTQPRMSPPEAQRKENAACMANFEGRECETTNHT